MMHHASFYLLRGDYCKKISFVCRKIHTVSRRFGVKIRRNGKLSHPGLPKRSYPPTFVGKYKRIMSINIKKWVSQISLKW